MGVTSHSKAGLRDWLVQRFTAVLMLFYMGYLFFLVFSGCTLAQWEIVFSYQWMKIFSVVFMLSLSWHAWIGFWTVLTDYVHSKPVRSFLLSALVAAIAIYNVWLIWILWFLK